MSHDKSCPCITCKSAKPQLWWLNFGAENQIIVKDGLEELLAKKEKEAAELFAEKVKTNIQSTLDKAAEKLNSAFIIGDVVSIQSMQNIISILKQERAKIIELITIDAVEYAKLITEAGFSSGASMLPNAQMLDVDAIVADLLGGRGNKKNPVLTALEETAEEMAKTITDSAINHVEEVIKIGIEEDLTGKEISALIDESNYSSNNAKVVARTQSASSYSQGQISAWESSGVAKGKKWLVSPGACSWCEMAFLKYGTESIPLEDDFILLFNNEEVALFGPPLHPNCRCSMIADIDY